MKIFVVGAGGPSGRAFIRQALIAGCDVTAFIRNEASFKNEFPAVTYVSGDVLKPESFSEQLRGHDAVVSFLGVGAAVRDKDVPPLRSEGTANILRAMEVNGIRRFICITSQGAGNTRFTSGLLGWFIVPFFMRRRFRDVGIQEKLIMKSSMDYTIVRPPMLTNAPYRGKYRHGRLFTFFFTSLGREDLAAFVIYLLTDNACVKNTVSVAY
jgi:putative NADH-flavin reductase